MLPGTGHKSLLFIKLDRSRTFTLMFRLDVLIRGGLDPSIDGSPPAIQLSTVALSVLCVGGQDVVNRRARLHPGRPRLSPDHPHASYPDP